MIVKDVLKNVTKFDLIPKHNFFVDLFSVISEMQQTLTAGFINMTSDEAMEMGEVFKEVISFIPLVKDLIFEIKAVELPEIVVGDEEINIGPAKMSVIKNASINSDLIIEFYASTSNIAKKLYYLWLKLMFDFKTGTQKARDLYEYDMNIYLFDRINTMLEKRTYHGCSPRNIEKTRYDYNEMGYQEVIVMTFKVNNGVSIDII